MARTTKTAAAAETIEVKPTTRTPEQQAALDAMRAAKAAKPVEPVEVVDAAADDAEVDTILASVTDGINKLTKRLGLGLSYRKVIAWFIAMLASAGLGYLIGWLIEPLLLGCLVTGSMFLFWFIAILAAVVAFIAGMEVGGAIYNYIVTEKIDAHYNVAKSFVLGWFKPSDKAPVVAAA